MLYAELTPLRTTIFFYDDQRPYLRFLTKHPLFDDHFLDACIYIRSSYRTWQASVRLYRNYSPIF